MTTLTNSLEGGTNGTTITTGNSGGVSGTAFDDVFIGAGGGLIFSNTHAAHGSLAMNSTSGASGVQAYGGWNSSLGSGLSQVWFRAYFYFASNPAANHGIVYYKTGAGGSQITRLVLSTAGKLIMQDAAGTAQLTSTSSIPLNTWWRVEGFCISSATVGQLEFKMFTSGMDNTSPDETQTSAANLNTGSGIGEELFGQAGTGSANENMFADDVGVSTTAYIGPVGGGVSQAGLLLASGMFPP